MTTIWCSAAFHLAETVDRAMPKRCWISFHGTRSARSQSKRTSSGSSQRSHSITSSMREIASEDGGPSRTCTSSQPYAS